MGMSDLPEIYAPAQRHSPSSSAYIFRQITSAHITTNIFHLGESAASVGNCRNVLQVYLYGFQLWITS